jgi:hypothetical protein
MDPRVKPAGDARGLEAGAYTCSSHGLPGPLVPAKAGTQILSQIGFPLEFTPAKAGAGMSGGELMT